MNTAIINLPHNRPKIAKNNSQGGKLPKKVVVLYSDDNPKYFTTEQQYLTVKGSYEDALLFDPHLKKFGIETCYIRADIQMTKNLLREKPDMVLNLVTTVKGYDYLGASVPSILEMLEIPYTGCSTLGFALGCNKYLIYALLAQHGLPVPPFQLMTTIHTPLDPSLRFPLILKLNEEHSNVEITMDSVVESEQALRKRLRYLMKTYEQEVLVSEFIEGREFAAFLFQSINKKVYIQERIINLPNVDPRFQFMDYNLVWLTDTAGKEYKERLKHQKYHDPLLSALIKKAFRVTNMDDYGKFDIRMDRLGNYYIIDANANCYFAPPESKDDPEITHTMHMYGISFNTLLKRLLQNTMREWGY